MFPVIGLALGCGDGGREPAPPSPADPCETHGTCDSSRPNGTGETGRTPDTDETGAPTLGLFVLRASEPDALFGDNVVGAGDLDGDGTSDVAVGAKGAAEAAGAVFVFLGPFAEDRSSDDADFSFLGELPGDFAGGGLAAPGDVDGDGTPDLLVGAKLSDRGGVDTGAAWLLYGPHGGGPLDSAGAIFPGEETGDEAGGSVSGAGDLDGDGRADLLVAAAGAEGGGRVYVVLGAPVGVSPLAGHTRLDADDAGDTTGGNLAALGDTDADGRADFAIGAGGADPFGVAVAGEVTVFTHLPTGVAPVGTADGRIHGTVALQALGAVNGPGDVDGDGYADVWLGAPGDGTSGFLAGSVFLVLGPIAGDRPVDEAVLTVRGEAGDVAGFSVSSTGAGELLAGAPGTSDRPGTSWRISGSTRGVHALADVGVPLVGTDAGDGNGHAVSGLVPEGARLSGAFAAGVGGEVFVAPF